MKVTWLNALPPRGRRLLLWTLGVLLFYTIVGFFILPPLVRAVAMKRLSKELERPVTIQKVRLNPFTLSATIRGLLIKDKDSEPLVSWDEVYVNFQLVSFFTRPWVFKEISTSQPYVRVQVNKDYTLNFSDLVEKFSKPSADPVTPEKSSKPLALRVELLRMSTAKVSLADLTQREPFRRTVGPLEITLTKFYTDPNSKNPYSFAGTTDGGEKFSWGGHFYLNPLRSQGEFTLEGISLNKYAPLYQDFVRFDIRDGVINLRSTYRFEKSAVTNVLAVTNTTFALKSLKMAEKGNEQNVVELAEFVVAGASADAAARQGEIASMSVSDGRFVLRRNKDESVNVLELGKPADTATNAAGGILLLLQSVTNAFAMLLQSTNLWTGTIHDITMTNCALRFEDMANARPVRLDLDQIAINAKAISNVPGKNMTASLSLRWETNGTIRTEVEATLSPPRADVQLTLDSLNLHPLDPYLEPRLNIFILRSKLGLNGTIHLRRTNDALPDVTFQGDVRLDDFSTVDGVMTEDFVKWSSLRISGIDANLNPPVISVKEIAVDDTYARLAIETNGTINLLTALHHGETNAPPGTPSVSKPKTKRAQKGPIAERGLQTASVSKLDEPQETSTAQHQAIAKRTEVRAPNAALPAKISIGSIVLSNAHLQFTDLSLQPNVNVSIEQVSGTISGLSSDELRHADVNLLGKVDKSAPVEITGKFNPLNQKQPTELKIVFKNVDLHSAGPYSGKFLGYRLNKGKLSMDLTYHVAERKLRSQNLIVLDQLMLGERVESPDAIKLPVRLAIAVLKDRNGRIELDVPIEGSLDDPEFHLGKIINRAILDVITKIVTSPFAALSAVFGGKGEEMSFQEFYPGSSELLPASIEKLDKLVKGLYERPDLQLEIEGSVDPSTDLDALRSQKLQKEFRTKKWKSLRKSEQARVTPAEVELAPEEFADYLKAAHAAAFSPQAIAARASQSGTTNSVMTSSSSNRSSKALLPARRSPEVNPVEKGATELMKKAASGETNLPVQDLEAQLLKTIEVTTSDFEALAAERAQRIKEYILQTGKAEPERIFLMQPGGQAVTFKGSRVYLHLQ